MISTISAFLALPAALYAAEITYKGSASDLQNTSAMAGGNNSLFPGTATDPSSSDNLVTIDYISSGTGTANPNVVFGGLSGSGVVKDNRVTLVDGHVNRHVYGGFCDKGAAVGNTVMVIGGSIGGHVHGGAGASSDITGNRVFVSGGSIRRDVYGGSGSHGNAADNAVIVSNGDIAGNVYGGLVTFGDATDNTVTISGGSIGWDVYGGWSDSNVTDNTVTISGGSIGWDVYGGKADLNATDNTVTISGAPDLTASNIYGGWSNNGGDAFTGNTLNLKSSNINVAGIANFENYNFYLPGGTADGDIMLSSASAVDVNNTNVAIFLQGDTALRTGDKIALINSAAGVNGSSLTTNYQAPLGTFLSYDFSIFTDSNNLWAQVVLANTAPQSKVMTTSRLAPLAFVSRGADLAANLDDFVVSRDKTDSRYTAFATVNGGSLRYDTGSHVDVDGFSMIAGVTWDVPTSGNQLLLSAFAEVGWGDYDTYNRFSGSSVRGGGDMNYYGGGLRARYQLTKDAKGGLYTDASLRVGKIDTDFNSKDLADINGTQLKYDSDSTYYGAHLGLGYVWKLNDKTNIDVSSKYLWTRLDGDHVVSTAGDRIDFDDADSRRWRTGFRVNHVRNGRVTLYGGLAYEYEFDGDADGVLFGTYAIDRSSLSGGTGIGELGIRFRPSANNDRLTLELGLQGYVGTREGVSGGLKLLYDF